MRDDVRGLGVRGDLGLTRVDLRTSDWLTAYEASQKRLRSVMQEGAAQYPTIERRAGTVYGTRREPPEEPATRERDEEIEMSGNETWLSDGSDGHLNYEEALSNAFYHANRATEESKRRNGREGGAMAAEAATSSAWSAVAALLREDALRRERTDWQRFAVEQLRERGQTPTGRTVVEQHPPLHNVPSGEGA